MSARRFRKKPVVIEAMQWDGSRPSIDAICRWANDPLPIDEDWIIAYNTFGGDDVSDPRVGTLEGDMRIGVGDWVIKGVKGEFYPCKPDVFQQSYEPVVGES